MQQLRHAMNELQAKLKEPAVGAPSERQLIGIIEEIVRVLDRQTKLFEDCTVCNRTGQTQPETRDGATTMGGTCDRCHRGRVLTEMGKQIAEVMDYVNDPTRNRRQ